jgi:hypothetical protein
MEKALYLGLVFNSSFGVDREKGKGKRKEERGKRKINISIYGALTTGTIWQFSLLNGDRLSIDIR